MNEYIVYKNGTVWSNKQHKFLKKYLSNKGYYTVFIYENGKRKQKLIHRLVAEKFIPNVENKPCIDHINGIRTDNRVENLRWCDHKENSNFPLAKKHHKCMINREDQSKKVYQYDFEGNIIAVFNSLSEVSRNGYNKGHVGACCRGERQKHRGYKWSYLKIQ